jgi:lysine-N-methylase
MTILHRSRTLPALMPRYVERFRCIGSACEDTCCAGWAIHIDKKTYKAYRQTTVPELSRLSTNILVRDANAASPARYAMIRPEGKTGQCALVQDGLCSVHQHLNETYLSDVCFTYPRASRQFNGQVEQALSLSCPEAARQALLAEDAFEFIEASVSVRDATVETVAAKQGMSVEEMNEVRIFCFNLLRTRDLALWQRLAMLGTFCAALSRLCAEGRQADVPGLIEDVVRLIEAGDLEASLAAITPNLAGQAMVFSVLWSTLGFESPSPFQQEVIRQISAGLGANELGQTTAAELVRAYTRGLERLDKALEAAPYLLEHYVANEMFLLVFPFEAGDAYDSYLRLIARFGLLRFLLAAQCNADENPSLSTLVATVQLHCRRFQHNKSYTDLVNSALQESGWAGFDKLQTLVKT